MSLVNCHLEVQHLVLPKAGSQWSECEDSIGIRSSLRRFCIADGATEAFDSRRWARLLTKHWVLSNRLLLTREQLNPWLSDLGASFRAHWEKRALPWYAEEKARTGAFATFLGMTFFESVDKVTWQAIAIGDSCCIHRRGERVQLSFPISDPAQFGFHPILLPSDAAKQDAAIDHIVIKDGRAEDGDVFLLLTDAIAAWYLQAVISTPELVAAFDSSLAANNSGELQDLIDQLRGDGSLRNDDIAVMRIAIGHPTTNRESVREMAKR